MTDLANIVERLKDARNFISCFDCMENGETCKKCNQRRAALSDAIAALTPSAEVAELRRKIVFGFTGDHNGPPTVQSHERAFQALDALCLRASQPRTCEWNNDDLSSSYTTQCGHAWEFTDGNAAHNDAKFCPFCGGSLIDTTFLTLDNAQRTKE